jgi:hypothetical protein
LKVSSAVRVDQPGFAPRPFLAGSETMGIALEQEFLLGAVGFEMVCRAEAEKRTSWDPMGSRQKASRCSAALKGKIGRLEAAARADVNEPGGVDLSLTGAFQEQGGSPRLSVESRLERLSAGCPVMTGLAALQLERKDLSFSLESGFEGVSLGALDVMRHFRLKVSWSTRCTLGR